VRHGSDRMRKEESLSQELVKGGRLKTEKRRGEESRGADMQTQKVRNKVSSSTSQPGFTNHGVQNAEAEIRPIQGLELQGVVAPLIGYLMCSP
jgi:hypothetical protein